MGFSFRLKLSTVETRIEAVMRLPIGCVRISASLAWESHVCVVDAWRVYRVVSAIQPDQIVLGVESAGQQRRLWMLRETRDDQCAAVEIDNDAFLLVDEALNWKTVHDLDMSQGHCAVLCQ